VVNYPVIPIVIDRHPQICMRAVKSRQTTPRIYERRLEEMALQTANLVALTKLPGVRVVNADSEEPEKSKFFTGMKVVDAAISSGIFARVLMNEGRFGGFWAAQEYVRKVVWEWFFDEKKKNSI
jgi:hypothetical protein